MKKKVIFAAVVAVMGVSAYVGLNAQQKDVMSDVQMANVDALVRSEDNPKEDCHYSEGYKAFTGKEGGAYDCCSIWVSKSPDKGEGNCH